MMYRITKKKLRKKILTTQISTFLLSRILHCWMKFDKKNPQKYADSHTVTTEPYGMGLNQQHIKKSNYVYIWVANGPTKRYFNFFNYDPS